MLIHNFCHTIYLSFFFFPNNSSIINLPQLRSLVEKGLLSQAPHWDLQRPFYMSCITQDTAVELAKTVNNFNLGDFMYYNNQHNPL